MQEYLSTTRIDICLFLTHVIALLCDTFQERELGANQRNVSFEKNLHMGENGCVPLSKSNLFEVVLHYWNSNSREIG